MKKSEKMGQFLLKTYGTSGSLISTILRTFFGAISCQIAQISSRNGNDRVTGHSQRQKQAKMIESVQDYWDFSPRVHREQKTSRRAKLSSSLDFSMIDFVPGPPKRVQNSANSTSIKMVIRSPPKGSS